MIYDTLSNAHHYSFLNENFQTAFAYLQNTDLNHLPIGRYEVSGDNVYVMIQDVDLCEWNASQWESHRKYADIQLLINGEELIGYCPTEKLTPAAEYQPDEDYMLYHITPGNSTTLHPGDFMIFFPQDAHLPGIIPPNGCRKSRKAIVKVRVAD